MSQYEYETNTYPENPVISYKTPHRSLIYTIISEGVYPTANKLAWTKKPNPYKIPDQYIVQTSYGKKSKHTTITCTIDYIENKPHFFVKFGDSLNDFVMSDQSASCAANAYQKEIDKCQTSQIEENPPKRIKKGITKWSGVLLFGLQLQQIKEIREKKYIHNLKPFDKLSESGKRARNKKLGLALYNQVQNATETLFCDSDKIVLNELVFSINNNNFKIIYNSPDKDSTELQAKAIVRAMDIEKISCSAYRTLAAINHNLPREWAIAKMRQTITNEINTIIKSLVFDLTPILIHEIPDNEEIDITNTEIIESVTKSIGMGAYRSIKEILAYLIPVWLKKGIITVDLPIIHIRISGDGRNVGKKVKHVMFTFTVLNDLGNIFKPDYHHTLILYPGIECYESLEIALSILISDLNSIKNCYIDKQGRQWQIKLYFSADWKMLALCLGHKAANSNHFCLWCHCNKNENGNLDRDWTIQKNIEEINKNYITINGHKNKPLFSMIPLTNWVPDELHLLLRITDRLWILILSELKTTKKFDNMRDIIVMEMKRIKIKFQFWQEQSSNIWQYTSLMGDDKLKMLREFDLSTILPPERAILIRKLWDSFLNLYTSLKSQTTTENQFKINAIAWLQLFLMKSSGEFNSKTFTKGLYKPNDITPYIHVMVYHIPEFIDLHRNFGIRGFSCSAVEKKNHQQVSFFFQKTLKDGGNQHTRKAAILEILDYDN
ncbi:2289_t:CDS:2 [Scutellospora calospora]|uniref:2289_t:CDS:1 n=1 Tax=Scutellospora calospora TaxID=85575 RepID=A0ACA9LK47_9GLOM|nr:2289_t:CDS:2 [Scutellospora calospora]